MNLKIKLTIAGQDLEITMEEARELKEALDKLLPVSLGQLRNYREAPSQPYKAPLPHFHQPSPHPFSPVTCDSGVTFLSHQAA